MLLCWPALSSVACAAVFIGMELVEDLEMLQAEDLDDPEVSFLVRWHKEKSMKLLQSITAGSASLREACAAMLDPTGRS